MTKANFFLVGAAKAGTTSIARFLEAVPDTYFSPIKEPCHFCPDINADFRTEFERQRLVDLTSYLAQDERPPLHMHLVDEADQYASLFRDVTNQSVIGEASTNYLPSHVAAQKIYDYNPAAKIVAVLRNPTDRIKSHYLMDWRTGLERRPLEDCLAEEVALGDKATFANCRMYLAQSDYTAMLERYRKIFPEKQILVLCFENVVADPELWLSRLLTFAELTHENGQLTLPRENANSHMARFSGIDHFLYKTGIKRFLEATLPHVLPVPMKKYIKKIYSKESAKNPPNVSLSDNKFTLQLEAEYQKNWRHN